MRVMDPDILFQDLEHLGFTSLDLIRYQQFINMPHGIVLVCGPTGSGKSTTLYSTLRYLSSPGDQHHHGGRPDRNGPRGLQPDRGPAAVGITFGSILRNILRQDPDIIMIGEMRDLETAENAVQAALTGHLVLSTLHTNDAPSSITRLLDLGVPAFLIKATLVGVLAQRLVRKICPHCKETFEIDPGELVFLWARPRENRHAQTGPGKGCVKCRGTGYLGRSGVYEVLPVTEPSDATSPRSAAARRSWTWPEKTG